MEVVALVAVAGRVDGVLVVWGRAWDLAFAGIEGMMVAAAAAAAVAAVDTPALVEVG